MEKVFLTGASGFIGTGIVSRLEDAGYEILNFDLKYDQRSPHTPNTGIQAMSSTMERCPLRSRTLPQIMSFILRPGPILPVISCRTIALTRSALQT